MSENIADEVGLGETWTNPIETDTELKNWLVEYVGERTQPEDGGVTVGMVVQTVAEEFPEFLMAVAEENWIRGYHQALDDVAAGEKAVAEGTIQQETDEQSETD